MINGLVLKWKFVIPEMESLSEMVVNSPVTSTHAHMWGLQLTGMSIQLELSSVD